MNNINEENRGRWNVEKISITPSIVRLYESSLRLNEMCSLVQHLCSCNNANIIKLRKINVPHLTY